MWEWKCHLLEFCGWKNYFHISYPVIPTTLVLKKDLRHFRPECVRFRHPPQLYCTRKALLDPTMFISSEKCSSIMITRQCWVLVSFYSTCPTGQGFGTIRIKLFFILDKPTTLSARSVHTDIVWALLLPLLPTLWGRATLTDHCVSVTCIQMDRCKRVTKIRKDNVWCTARCVTMHGVSASLWKTACKVRDYRLACTCVYFHFCTFVSI